jgi:hypothetical protein
MAKLTGGFQQSCLFFNYYKKLNIGKAYHPSPSDAGVRNA